MSSVCTGFDVLDTRYIIVPVEGSHPPNSSFVYRGPDLLIDLGNGKHATLPSMSMFHTCRDQPKANLTRLHFKAINLKQPVAGYPPPGKWWLVTQKCDCAAAPTCGSGHQTLPKRPL